MRRDEAVMTIHDLVQGARDRFVHGWASAATARQRSMPRCWRARCSAGTGRGSCPDRNDAPPACSSPPTSRWSPDANGASRWRRSSAPRVLGPRLRGRPRRAHPAPGNRADRRRGARAASATDARTADRGRRHRQRVHRRRACARAVRRARDRHGHLAAARWRVARRNAERHGVADRMRFVGTSLLEGVEPGDRPDRVESAVRARCLAVRPVIRGARLRACRSGVRRRGRLRRLRSVLERSAAELAPGGWLLMEFGCGQDDQVRASSRSLRRWRSRRFATTCRASRARPSVEAGRSERLPLLQDRQRGDPARSSGRTRNSSLQRHQPAGAAARADHSAPPHRDPERPRRVTMRSSGACCASPRRSPQERGYADRGYRTVFNCNREAGQIGVPHPPASARRTRPRLAPGIELRVCRPG